MDETEELPDLSGVISLAGFDFLEYLEQEQLILKPRMEELGYSSIVFAMGEEDDFGPLTRIVQCVDPEGNDKTFFYG